MSFGIYKPNIFYFTRYSTVVLVSPRALFQLTTVRAFGPAEREVASE
jgi:hypothetical protein